MSEWWRGAVIYQIYPRSFRDANGDGVGDLKGIAEKLDYVASLGVDGVWLSPFFTSPMRDYGYDVSDYCGVDPLFGTLADFDALLARAHGLGLKVIIDQVFSHSSDQHPWFAESRANRTNPKADWYVWADAKPDGTPPNNWQSLFGGGAWEWDTRRRQYYLHNFLTSQPDLNVANPQVQDALLAASKFWLDRGVDGFRFDVINFCVHDAQLRDNPTRQLNAPPARPFEFQHNLYNRSRPETLAFVARIRALLDAYPGRYSVGEIEDEDALTRQREYTDGPDRLHTAYSFFLLRAREATPALFLEAMRGWEDAEGWPAWSLSNHDVPRMGSRLAHDDPRQTRLLLAILLCLRGTTFLYQGDELGLPQAEVPFEKLRDPEAIAFWPNGIGRDGARTPMPWTAAQDGGFSTGEPWLPIDSRHLAQSVAGQAQDPGAMLAFAKTLIALRKAHPALREGGFKPLPAPGGVLLFERATPSERLICAFNLTGQPVRASLEAPLESAEVLPTGLPGAVDGGTLALPAFGGTLVRLISC